MPDPVSEGAEYVVIARGGIAKLFLSERGRLQDPGAVAVLWARRVGGTPVTRWLRLIRSALTRGLPGIGADAEVSHRISDPEQTRSGSRECSREAA